MSYNSYKIRLGIKDSDFNSRALANSRSEFDRNITKSPNYKEVLLDGITKVDAIVTEYSYTLTNLDKKKLSTSYNSNVALGKYVKFDDANWLIVTTKNYTIDAYKENIIERCNLNPLMYKVGNFVYSDYGVYYNKEYLNQAGGNVNIPKDNIDIKLPLNVNTKKIRLNDMFFIFEEDWYEAYKVVSLNRSYKEGNNGILGIRAEIVDSDISPQKYYNLEPTSETISKVLVSPSDVSPSKGQTTQLTVKVYDSLGVLIPDAEVVWSTNNANIATVSANGLVTAVDVGICNIIATSVDEDTVYGSCEVNVLDGGGWF